MFIIEFMATIKFSKFFTVVISIPYTNVHHGWFEIVVQLPGRLFQIVLYKIMLSIDCTYIIRQMQNYFRISTFLILVRVLCYSRLRFLSYYFDRWILYNFLHFLSYDDHIMILLLEHYQVEGPSGFQVSLISIAGSQDGSDYVHYVILDAIAGDDMLCQGFIAYLHSYASSNASIIGCCLHLLIIWGAS